MIYQPQIDILIGHVMPPIMKTTIAYMKSTIVYVLDPMCSCGCLTVQLSATTLSFEFLSILTLHMTQSIYK